MKKLLLIAAIAALMAGFGTSANAGGTNGIKARDSNLQLAAAGKTEKKAAAKKKAAPAKKKVKAKKDNEK